MHDPDRIERQAIVAALRTGAVPKTGLQRYATGLDRLVQAIDADLDEVAPGHGRVKWVRGEYGSGKTFATRMIAAHARGRGFATAEVQISTQDAPLHHFETVYRRIIERLTTVAAGEGALGSVVDAWVYEIGEEVIRLRGIDEEDPAFVAAVDTRMEERLAQLAARAPAFATALRAYHSAQAAGEFATAQGLLAWIGGQTHVGQVVLRQAGLRGGVDGAAAIGFLRGVLQLLRESGHQGLLLVLDEVETIQRMPANVRDSALQALRGLVDAIFADELPGLYLVVTGTPELYDGHKGLRGSQPLYQRVMTRFDADPRFDNLRAPQVRLLPFDVERLSLVAERVRDLYPSAEPERLRATFDDAALAGLVERTTRAFGARIAVAPRLFLRELVDILDRVEQHPDYRPPRDGRLEFDQAELTPAELGALRVTSDADADADADADPDADADAPTPTPEPKPRRLDG